MKRKLLSLVLAFAMTAGLLTVGAGAAGPAYGDNAGHWAEGSIGRWSEHGIVQGSNGAFAPQRAHRPRARHGHIGTRNGHRAHRKSRFDEIRWSPTICCRSLFPWSNRVLLSLNSRNPCFVEGVAIRLSEKCSSWLFSHPASKYKKRRLKRTASVSVFLCAFPFHKNFIHAHAPQP